MTSKHKQTEAALLGCNTTYTEIQFSGTQTSDPVDAPVITSRWAVDAPQTPRAHLPFDSDKWRRPRGGPEVGGGGRKWSEGKGKGDGLA